MSVTPGAFYLERDSMTETDKQIIAGMTGIDKALWFAKRDGEKRVPPISDRVELASRLGVTGQAIHNFVKQGWLPRDRAAAVHEMYGVPLAELVKPA